MAPTAFLVAMVLMTAVAYGVDQFHRRRSHRELKTLAAAHGLHYSPVDRLRLTPRIAGRLPIVGAAAVRVIDVMYMTDADRHWYVFTAEFTVGVTGPKTRVRRAAAFCEGKSADLPVDGVRFADDGLSLRMQYESLLGGASSTGR